MNIGIVELVVVASIMVLLCAPVLILVIVLLLVFGPTRLGEAIRRATSGFREGLQDRNSDGDGSPPASPGGP